MNIFELDSPLMWAWHLTNECNMLCIHCLWPSGPRMKFQNELSTAESLDLCKKIADFGIPYVALSGGEPLLYPGFWEVSRCISDNAMQLKIESNGQFIDKETAVRLSKLNLKSVQISIDGASPKTFSLVRQGGSFEKAVSAVKYLVEEGVDVEIVFVPTKLNINEIEKTIDLAYSLGAKAFLTQKTMYLGRAISNWKNIGLNNEDYAYISTVINKKSKEYKNMKILFYPYDSIEELQHYIQYPPASPLMISNGKVILTTSIPYVVADVRKHSMEEIWERYKKGWRHPKVKEWVEEVTKNPEKLSLAHNFVDLSV
ncbi:radical SAM protein [Acidianus ambivalens]|uniref:Radical SAM protein n=2 Tax=Acidianus ambivalens TaxID=2283 RepID=A0A650CWX2_ACIAM|nr:radical SAM protein [Acidianus ambivalens]QGR21947.1 radical SAM protein [Acidianus ambivalens]